MRIEYTGRQIEVDENVRILTERKLRKLAKVLHGITHAHVILTSDRHRRIVELTVQSPNLTLAASEESSDIAVSLNMVINKLVRQSQRHLGKLRTRKRAARQDAGVWSGVLGPVSDGDGERPRVIQSRRFVAKPMTVDEAVIELGKSPDELLVFRQAGTERISVLYRRKDGNLGIIEPEA
ncbi:MAG: ribosome-associated translation inhibitor RaiA [Vicinamibacteria bacterium]|nr:ribosome-associated translation inhibitor RaiA [Vicinamibacteria bacterium]